MKNKKAALMNTFLGMAFLILVIAIIFSPQIFSPTEYSKYIGEQQYHLLESGKDAAILQKYVEDSFSYAAKDAVFSLLSYSGYYLEQTEFATRTEYPCGTHIHPIYSLFQENCLPLYLPNYKSFVYEDFQNYEEAYPYQNLQTIMDFSITPAPTSARLSGTSTKVIKIPIGNQENREVSVTEQNSYSSYELGSYGNETIVSCTSGDCFAQVAETMYAHYAQDGTTFPYVWGGESPYSYEDTIRLANIPGSIFNGVSITATQPGKNKATVPGFDCSGWTWWVGKHAGVPDFSGRRTADGYWQRAKQNGAELVCGVESTIPCYLGTILERAQPGDILYYGTPSSASHIMIYVGDGQIIHSVGSRGLVKEYIPQYYASASNTRIVAVYRHAYATEGVNSFESSEKLQDKVSATTLIGPGDAWCAGQSASISSTYESRITLDAYGVSGTLKDIAIQAGLEQQLDPALIATHMQFESSMTPGGSCSEQGKSSLTGCGWFPSCSNQCGCDNGNVINDYTQAQCTAKVDAHAYTEALSGRADLSSGRFEECNAYTSDPEQLWTCILCIYQGNYDRDITGKNNPYFTRDGTCNYAESFKTGYCAWRNYFAEEGYDVSTSISSTQLRTNNYMSFQPIVDTTAKISFPELERVTEFVKETSTTCTDNLYSCLEQQTQTHSQNSPTMFFSNETNTVLVDNIMEQIYDCDQNGQLDCYCEINIDKKLIPEKGLSLQFTQDGSVYAGNYQESIFASREAKKYGTTIYALTGSLTGEADLHEYVEFLIPKNGDIRFDSEDIGLDYSWIVPEPYTMYLLKTPGEYLWVEPRDIDPYSICREPKIFFPLEVSFSSMEQNLSFSLELQDTQAPPLLSSAIDELYCAGLQTILLEWTLPQSEEPVYGFTVSFDGQQEQFLFIERLAQPFEESPVAGTLYKTTLPTETRYAVLLTHLPNKNVLEYNRTYTFTLSVYDHYLNEQNNTFTYKILLENQEIATIIDTEHPFIKSGFPDAQFCTPGDYVVIETLGQTPTHKPLYDLNNVQLPNIPVSKPSSSSDFEPQLYRLPNGSVLHDSIYNKPVYSFAGIPNIVCDESTTEVKFSDPNKPGRICGASKELVEQLHYLATDFLVPEGYQLYINQAFRTYDIQQYFWRKYVDSGYNKKYEACNPNNNPPRCRHMVSGAIDVTLQKINSRGVSYAVSHAERERVMCQYDFIRYIGEQWHYEYGTSRWKEGTERGVCAI